MKVDSKDQAKRRKAANALCFLNDHPAFLFPCSFDFLGNQMLVLLECCKRGITDSCVTIRRGDKGWKRFEAKFKAEEKEYQEKIDYIYVDYEEAFGEKWKFDHVKYFYDIDIFVFEGDPNNIIQQYDYKMFERYHGFEGSAYTFEDAIIQCAKKTKELFGDFSKEENFLTKKERKNHEKHDIFLLNQMDTEDIIPATDPDYIEVTDAAKNIRWAQWFSKTEHYKKNYSPFSGKALNRKWDGVVIP